MEGKLWHLESIQSIITRMNSNSFMIKGWCITIISAIFVLSQKDANIGFLLFAILPTACFWILDGFYISQERKYRELYISVSKKKEEEIDYSMNTKQYNKFHNCWFAGIVSKTLIPFYGVITIGVIFVYFLIKG